jgi:hypothetical protein
VGVAAFSRGLDQKAFATFLAKILMSAFFTHDRPGRASPRKTKKVGDFSARKPGEPSVTKVTRTIESAPGSSPESNAIGA